MRRRSGRWEVGNRSRRTWGSSGVTVGGAHLGPAGPGARQATDGARLRQANASGAPGPSEGLRPFTVLYSADERHSPPAVIVSAMGRGAAPAEEGLVDQVMGARSNPAAIV